jgi:hypothetical protein
MTVYSELAEKIKNNEELTEKERMATAIAVKFLENCRYQNVPNVPFICGEAGEKGKDGMPEFFFIAPTYGVDGFAVYKKDKDYDAPGW